MGNLALALDRALAERAAGGFAGKTKARLLASGNGWSVHDVICTCGPGDRPFEERHEGVAIAVVAAGTFQYRSGDGRALMTPGALFLGSEGRSFECEHAHGTGDRCVSFHFEPEFFSRIASAAGGRGAGRRTGSFPVLRIPPSRETSALVAAAAMGTSGPWRGDWEELSVTLAGRAARLAEGLPADERAWPTGTDAVVSRMVRDIERDHGTPRTLDDMARQTGLSPYHFLRMFQRLTGVTPHQYVLRTRLRAAALRLLEEQARILDIALDCGFGDVSNFNHAFKAEFGVSPREYRR